MVVMVMVVVGGGAGADRDAGDWKGRCVCIGGWLVVRYSV
jgi:hypothetical protein